MYAPNEVWQGFSRSLDRILQLVENRARLQQGIVRETIPRACQESELMEGYLQL